MNLVSPSYYSQTLTDQVSLSQQTPHQWTYTVTTDVGVKELKVQTRGKKVEVVLQNQNITTLPGYAPYLYSAPVRVDDETVAKILVRVTPDMYEVGGIEVRIYKVPTHFVLMSLPSQAVIHFFKTIVR
ncbi:MAG: hypothetical protein JST80_09785 [Bdellovibrionales bacterium]|nr:hypothetical protein [Bdellovibrionales bacterium]